MLHEFVAVHREEIIRRCRAKVAARPVPPPTTAEIEHGVPVFLEQLVDALVLQRASHPEIGTSAALHGHDLLRQGCTVSQVVHDYGDVCQAITELAVETSAPISAEEFRLLNGYLDDAIAGAVSEYARQRTVSDIDGESARGSERLGFLAHELRNLTHTALVAFEVLRSGNVGVAGSTGAVLHRSLKGIGELVGRSLAEVRLTQSVQHPTRFLVSEFVDELVPAATLEASARGITLTVRPIEDDITIEADRDILASAIGNLLQNAFKFTRPHTTVTLSVRASTERVVIEVEDECGGLPTGNVDELFRPYEQRSADRTGVGLGLAFSRWAVEANHGRIATRNLPAKGCVFAINLPRCPLPALAH
jgi:signal transduction histidine kinase